MIDCKFRTLEPARLTESIASNPLLLSRIDDQRKEPECASHPLTSHFLSTVRRKIETSVLPKRESGTEPPVSTSIPDRADQIQRM